VDYTNPETILARETIEDDSGSIRISAERNTAFTQE
jgi:hypothetical protein